MPTAKEMDDLWAADFALKQIPLQPRLPGMRDGKVVGYVEYDKKGEILRVKFYADEKPAQENPPQVGG